MADSPRTSTPAASSAPSRAAADVADAAVATTAPNTPATTAKTGTTTRKKIGFTGLYAIVISAMVGGGVFSLPQNMAVHAGAGAQIVAWIVTGIGMWFIADVFRTLTHAEPNLKDGIFTYAYAGFGRFPGFLVAYGYWLCNCFSLIAYGVLIFSTLNEFFPGTFAGGNNWAATIGSSIVLWVMIGIALLGTKTGSTINIVGTLCKVVPILLFLVMMVVAFRWKTFTTDFWGTGGGFDLGKVVTQVDNSMLVTLWLFLGIEGAVVVSGEARSPRDVSRATLAGYISVLVMYVLVALLPLGVYSAKDVGAMANPSMAVIMQERFGTWGSVVINIGVIVSVIFAWLVWLLMISQMPLYAARDGIFPKSFDRENRHGAPLAGLIFSGVACQILFIVCHFVSGSAWDTMISITSVMAMPCYLLCCMYQWKIAAKEKDVWKTCGVKRGRALAIGICGTGFSLYLVYSAGLKYLMVACALYAIGVPIYFLAGKDRPKGTKLFTRAELVILVLLVVVGVIGIIYTARSGLFG